MRRVLALALVIALPSAVLAAPAPATAPVPRTLTPADRAAAFRAAGFERVGQAWRACEDTGPAYTPGEIEQVVDLNADGRPEAIIVEGSAMCFGNTGMSYTVVSKQPDGSWKLITGGIGLVTVLATRGVGGWADLEIGGPGFCFPVHRWNGREYDVQRHQYRGKACRPG